jgi:hypothetical protein
LKNKTPLEQAKLRKIDAQRALQGIPKLYSSFGAAYNDLGTAWVGFESTAWIGTQDKLVLYWAPNGSNFVEEVDAKILREGQKMTATYPEGNIVVEMEIVSVTASAAGVVSSLKTSSAKINGLAAEFLPTPKPVQLKAQF